MSAFPLKQEVEYPSSDGKPMAETDLHRDEMVYVIEGLRLHFRDEPDVYVSGNILLYYVKGDPTSSVSPDGLVARGLSHAKERRDIYKVWEEGRPPGWVIEVTSRKTRREDLRRKKDLYESLGIEEYFLYDPREEYLDPPLQGYRLLGDRYQPVSPEPNGFLFSRVLNMFLTSDQAGLRLIDAETGEVVLTREEEREAFEAALKATQGRLAQEAQERQVAETARRAAEQRALTLEEELARLRLELDRSRKPAS
jgi:Uma2 family endonuclease